MLKYSVKFSKFHNSYQNHQKQLEKEGPGLAITNLTTEMKSIQGVKSTKLCQNIARKCGTILWNYFVEPF